MISKFSRYWHTLHHLKPVQFYGRLWFRLHNPIADTTALVPPLRVPRGSWQAPAARTSAMLGAQKFQFLNREHSLPERGGWDDSGLDKLWLYNLHYFDDLNARDAPQRSAWHRALIQRWVKENPPASGNGWEPYPTSLRIVNWIKWRVAGNRLIPGLEQSLTMQVRWLCKRLEHHLQGNHLFVNAKALVFAGLYFDGRYAAHWRNTGLAILERELPEQVLTDGGNFERSTMYHAICLEDVLDLVNAATYWPDKLPEVQVRQWRETAGRMLKWLTAMTHPDGEISLFNDAAFGIAPTLSELRSYAKRIGISCDTDIPVGQSKRRLVQFPDSGYVRLEQNHAVAFLDVAPVGPDYLPGHAHADTLSFELSVFGHRVVVNGGTSRYGLGPERLRERGTASHSTVEVAGQDSSEVWGGFRVARRAYPMGLEVRDDTDVLRVACSHDGYRRLPGAPIHRREWAMRERSLRVTDRLQGGGHTALARFILHPDAHITSNAENWWQLSLSGGNTLHVTVLVGRGRIEPASYAPEFGLVLPTQCLTVELVLGQSEVEWAWG